MVLQYVERNEVKDSLKSYYDAYGIDYDDEDVGTLRHEVDLKGFIGYEKVSNKTLKLNFNDGDVIRVNVNPKKMASVIDKISNKELRRQRVCVKCF